MLRECEMSGFRRRFNRRHAVRMGCSIFAPAVLSSVLVAGAVLALTPVAVIMFRFDDPDALPIECVVSSVES